ncbi:hypothetical protein [Oceanobacillus limi]|uniref:hypothetical protein n=1 Tax=Oceanobacillus limi TaxID=930131 RepID=UPI000B82FCE9|nr:hypothetical protein [Oceanobacillus limi]
MKIKETESSVIINGYRIDGFIDHEMKCDTCHTNLVLYEHYDSFFCPRCNEWTENTCDDPECSFCVMRPKEPIQSV